jgi:hypothetical protein
VRAPARPALPAWFRAAPDRVRAAVPGTTLVAVALALTTGTAAAVVAGDVVQEPVPGGTATLVLPSPTASTAPEPPPVPEAETLARPAVPPQPVAPLAARLRPDVLVKVTAPLAPEQVQALAPEGQKVSFRAGTVSLAGRDVPAVGVDPSTFRAFTAEGTAEADAVWQAVARGEFIASHALGQQAALQLGATLPVTPAGGGEPVPLRLGALATTGIPAAELVVDEATAERLGLQPTTAVVVTAVEGKDPVVLAEEVRKVVGDGAQVDLLSPPTQNPVAFLSGSKAAKAFGAFSYRYFPDGTIAPDAKWVSENIVTTTVPIMGRVTCHRLMVPQLRGALEEVQAAGLGQLLRTYDGCYVPRFIARNPDNSISLHTWGIAIDMDASTNYRGIRGTMDIRIVEIFKRWGFRWGGDWQYTDPMHFELGALLTTPSG